MLYSRGQSRGNSHSTQLVVQQWLRNPSCLLLLLLLRSMQLVHGPVPFAQLPGWECQRIADGIVTELIQKNLIFYILFYFYNFY
jgi:hypothetical protein